MDEERFWSAEISELVQGYVLRDGILYCLVCGAAFPKGEIFPKDGHFYDTETMAALHLKEAHRSMLDDLLTLPASTLGLSPAQLELVRLLAQEKKAKLFLALIELLRAGGQAEEIPFCTPHRTAAMVDARYAVTQEERDAILSSCFDPQGALLQFPTKEKKKLVVLRAVADHFKPGRQYTEVEINRILGRIYEDYPYLRRLLIEYGFLERTPSGSSYWRKECVPWRPPRLSVRCGCCWPGGRCPALDRPSTSSSFPSFSCGRPAIWPSPGSFLPSPAYRRCWQSPF